MSHGERLTEYTAFELQVLLDAVTLNIVALDVDDCTTPNVVNTLYQWKTKIIEAKTEVRVREIQNEN